MSIRAVIEDKEYTQSDIVYCRVYGELFSQGKLCVGSATSKQLDLQLINPPTIGRGAEIKLYYDDTPQGTYYIDTRETQDDGILILHAYDRMLMSEEAWLNETYDDVLFPIAETDMIDDICNRLGLERASDVVVSDFGITYAVGEYGDLTMREILCGIAGTSGGNFYIGFDGKLHLSKLNTTPATTHNIGRDMTDLNISPAWLPVSDVYINADTESGYYHAGNGSGATVEFYCPWSTPGIVQDVLNTVIGYEYIPYSAVDAIVPITAELGDGVIVSGTTSIIASIDRTYGGLNVASLSAPGEQEIDSEYPYKSLQERRASRELARAYTKITKTASDVMIQITTVQDAVQNQSEQISNTESKLTELDEKTQGFTTQEDVDNSINSALTGGVNSVTTTTGYTFNADGLYIAKSGEEMQNKLDNTGMYVTRNNEAILTANNKGVEALNLTARQYLIVGTNSRFEDYTGDNGEPRTGCFWIGG